jgi:hypothetical protein
MDEEDTLEIVANLWFVHDNQGFIYSLRGRLYLASGTDSEKLALLRRHAESDYLIAKPFPVPERLHTTFIEEGRRQKLAVVGRDSLEVLGGEMVLFEEVLVALEDDVPAQTSLQLGQSPLVVITPLLGADDGAILPSFSKRRYL